MNYTSIKLRKVNCLHNIVIMSHNHAEMFEMQLAVQAKQCIYDLITVI